MRPGRRRYRRAVMLTVSQELSDLRYAHALLEAIGPEIRIFRLIQHDRSGWPTPLKRMDNLVRLGWARRELVDGKPIFYLDPPPLVKAKAKKHRYKVKVSTSPTVKTRHATCVLCPNVGTVTDLRPSWCDELWVVEFRGKLPGGWLIRVVQRV